MSTENLSRTSKMASVPPFISFAPRLANLSRPAPEVGVREPVLERSRTFYSLFFPGRRVRAHLQNPATKCDFSIGYFIFLLTLEKCAILQCSVLSIRSKLQFLFHRVLVFLSCFVRILCCVRLFIKKTVLSS
jgi:hypothetical protein